MPHDNARRAAVVAGLNGLTEADLGLLAKSLEANRTLGDRARFAARGYGAGK